SCENQFITEVSSDLQSLTSAPDLKENSQRPFYIISHRCNDKEDISLSIENGTNAIECDVWLDKNNIWWVNHDLFKTTLLSEWLKEAKVVAKIHEESFALVIFDIKTPKKLLSLKTLVNTYLPEDLNVIYSIAALGDANAFEEIAYSLNTFEGLSIDFENSPKKVANFLNTIEVENYWYGNGITAALPDTETLRNSLKQAAILRDEELGIKKTYTWTLEKKSTMEDYILNQSVDGFIINAGAFWGRDFSENAIEVLLEHSDYIRKAKRSDNAFQRFENND
ncbi:hypothetical protein, partial [Xanthovirga aplysinae]|uniref:hypothetical protein n=1 Tax=Xanthovirga aplysinae TaxID=2529853 RepID=UPI00165706EA